MLKMLAVPPEWSAAERRKINRAFGGPVGLGRENGNMMAPKYIDSLSKVAWSMRRLKRLNRKPL